MIRNLKLISGLILFLFIALHLSNLAFGVFSLQLVDEIRPVLMAPFSNLIGGNILIACMLLHTALGLYALYQRNTLRMSQYDAVQFASAVIIPPLLIPHVWGLIALRQLLDINPTYLDMFRAFWIDTPLDGLRQVLLVVAVWIHGCIGLFTWLRLYPWWSRASLFAYPLAVAIPVMALLGFVAGGNHILAQNQEGTGTEVISPYTESAATYSDTYNDTQYGADYSPQTVGENGSAVDAEFQATIEFINRIKWQLIIGYLILVALVLTAWWLRIRSKRDQLEVHYADGNVVTSAVGPSLLEMSNMSDIPHANLCRGRGRCGTCRVEILYSENTLPEPGKIEQKTLGQKDTASNVRLACQLNPPAGVIKIRRLMPPDMKPSTMFDEAGEDTAVAGAEPPQPSAPNTPA